VLDGKLPQVSWIVAPATYSEHPGPSSPVQGGWYIQEVLDALTASPEVWSKTVFIVNFDENDGYFDHMPSPAAPSLNPDPKSAAAGKTTLSDADVAFERHNYPLVGSSTVPAPTAACTARARACRCMSSRLGAVVAGSTRRCSTTPRCCVSWNSASV
jgi:phospholipase C